MKMEQFSPQVWPGSGLEDQSLVERVAQQDVRYLCFEGGGGKGVIYIGAVEAMAQRGILTYAGGRLDPNGQIRGIAGSSAGALTAVMLSIGYTPPMLRRLILRSFNFNRFFDLPGNPARVPTPTGCRSSSPDVFTRFIRQVFGRFGGGLAMRLLQAGTGGGNPDAGFAEKLASSRLFAYLLNLQNHMGVFSGCAAHQLFNRLIARQAARRVGQAQNWRAYLNLSFEQHRDLFGTELVLTGSNFSTGRTAFFSAETTPRFPVAAAARISMSLPLIFKPMKVSLRLARQYVAPSGRERALSADDLAGVWVDGGYFNNLPQYAFVHRPQGFRRTLGFSLSDFGSGPRRIESLVDFLAAYANFGLFGTGESQSSASTGVAPNRIDLVAGNRSFQIETTDFAFRPQDLPQVNSLIADARTRTLQYF